jgi:hypothetical protein
MQAPRTDTIEGFFRRNRTLTLDSFLRRHPNPFLVEVASDDESGENPKFGTMVDVKAGMKYTSEHDSEISPESFVHPLVKRSDVFPDKITVGRAPNNDLVFDHPTISKLHAYFTVDPKMVFLSDADSKNGSSVDKRKLTAMQKTECPNGAFIGFGPRLRFILMHSELFYDRMVSTMQEG